MAAFFNNEHEAEKQGREVVGHYNYYGSQVDVYSALPGEEMTKYIGRVIEYKHRDSDKVHRGKVIAAGYGNDGSNWRVVMLEPKPPKYKTYEAARAFVEGQDHTEGMIEYQVDLWARILSTPGKPYGLPVDNINLAYIKIIDDQEVSA